MHVEKTFTDVWQSLQLLKDRQAADPQHDSHIGEPINDTPSVSDYGSLDAQSLLQLHTTSPKLRTAESPMGLGEAVASSIDSLLSSDPRIATMAKDYESEQLSSCLAEDLQSLISYKLILLLDRA